MHLGWRKAVGDDVVTVFVMPRPPVRIISSIVASPISSANATNFNAIVKAGINVYVPRNRAFPARPLDPIVLHPAHNATLRANLPP